jgi:hypothetical protein
LTDCHQPDPWVHLATLAGDALGISP